MAHPARIHLDSCRGILRESVDSPPLTSVCCNIYFTRIYLDSRKFADENLCENGFSNSPWITATVHNFAAPASTSQNMDPPDNYQTKYDSKTKIVVFYSLGILKSYPLYHSWCIYKVFALHVSLIRLYGADTASFGQNLLDFCLLDDGDTCSKWSGKGYHYVDGKHNLAGSWSWVGQLFLFLFFSWLRT